jgi:hypothetical protein
MMMEEQMRTTVVLKDDLVKKAKKLSGETTLSALLNSCPADWIAQHNLTRLLPSGTALANLAIAPQLSRCSF